MSRQAAFRILATLFAAFAAAHLCRFLHVPLPWMIGPLMATALASLAGARTQSWRPAINVGQWIIGGALGLYFTPEIVALVGRLWWAVLLAIAWALAVGWLFGSWLDRGIASLPLGTAERRATSYFAGAIGGASEMTLLCEREGGRTDLVAAAHSLRMLIVTLALPFALTWAGVHGVDVALPGTREVHPRGLVLLAALTLAGSLLLSRTRIATPWFLGSMGVSMGLTLAGISLSALPVWASNLAQLLIGVSLGVRFRAEFVRTAPRWLARVTLGTVLMVLLCAGFALLLARVTGLHPATLVLGTSPGGISEMAITAKVLQLGVPVVTAFQVCRLIAVLLLVAPLYRRLYRRD